MNDGKDGFGFGQAGRGMSAAEAAEELSLDNPVAGETVEQLDAVPGGGEDPLQAARAEAISLKDQLLRALAETENVRRRAQRDREDAQKYAAANFARDMLSVADNLRRALDNIPAAARAGDPALEALATGVEMTERELLTALERHGIRKIEPVGERFDSNYHQAMFEVPGTGQPTGTVVQMIQPGYMIHDRLLRPAMVGVAKEAQGNGPAPSGGNGAFGAPGTRFDTRA